MNISDVKYNQPIVSGKDSYAFALNDQTDNDSTFSRCEFNAPTAEWGLKLPNITGTTLNSCNLVNGKERALDAVRGGNLTANDCVFGCGTDRAPITSKFSLKDTTDIGLKGGFKSATLNCCILTDMWLGDFSIYDDPTNRPPVSGIELIDCVHPAGKDTPIIIRCLNADRPKISGTTNAVIWVWPRIFVWLYFWYEKKFGDTRKGDLTT